MFAQGAGTGIDTRSVGEVIHAMFNPDPTRWVPLDGADVYRSQWPELAAKFPIGVFTSTIRTLNASPVVSVIAADSTNFLAPGAAGTSPLQASPDAITWSTSATWTAATSPACIILAGSRFIMAGSGGDLTVPYVATTGQTAANIVAKANWTATTVAGTSSLVQGLAYGSTANAGAGRTVLVPNGAGTAVFSLDDGATAWTSRTVSSATPRGIVWTGQKFIIPTGTNLAHVSTDGATWTDVYLPFSLGAWYGFASDGKGTIVMAVNEYIDGSIGIGYCLQVSTDHGSTWRRIVPGMLGTSQGNYGYPQYANGRFIIVMATQDPSGALISTDGLAWQTEPLFLRGVAYVAPYQAVAYKSGVYCCIKSAASGAISAVEDLSKFSVPPITSEFAFYSGVGVSLTSPSAFMNSYIKARSN